MDAAEFDQYIAPFQAFVVHTALYSLHTGLFALALYVLLKRRAGGFQIHLSCNTLLFVLSTASYLCSAIQFFERSDTTGSRRMYFYDFVAFWPLARLIRSRGSIGNGIASGARTCYIISNLVADLYITYRCYIVWGRSRRVIVLPSLLIITTLVLQITPFHTDSESEFDINAIGSMTSTFVTNLLMTALTAGRIWWIGRKARSVMLGRGQSRNLRTVQIILESGLLYPVTLFASLVMHWVMNWGPRTQFAARSVFAANLTAVVIAPTLIVIRVGLGVSANDVTTSVEALRMAQPLGSRSGGASSGQESFLNAKYGMTVMDTGRPIPIDMN